MPKCQNQSCTGSLIVVGGMPECMLCGARPNRRALDATSPIARRAHSTNKLDSDFSWIPQNIKDLGTIPIRDVRCILNQLPPPFNAAIDVPCFSDDPEYRREQGQIVRDRGKANRRGHLIKRKEPLVGRLTKRKEIDTLTAPLPKEQRQSLRFILHVFDAHVADRIALEDCRIRWFKKIIAQEEALLPLWGRINKAGKCRELFSSTFIESLSGSSIFSSSCYGDEVQMQKVSDQLRQARAILDKACARLTPAKAFYLSPHIPRRIKDTVLGLCSQATSKDRRGLSVLAAELLKLADPERPAKAPALRERFYQR